MGSNTSKSKTAIIPRIPQDIIDEILDHLAAGLDFRSLRACALVSKSWVQSCRQHLFHTVVFTYEGVDRWFAAFPVPEDSPARHVRDFGFWIRGAYCFPEQFLGYTPLFPNVESISLLGDGGRPLSRTPSFWRMPQSVTALTIDTSVVSLAQIRNIMAQLPNLNDLSLSGSLIPVDKDILPGAGTTLGGKLGGRLLLRGGCAGKDVINMLLDIPSGLRFTEVHVYCMRERLLPVIRLAEACGNTLVKLSHTVVFHDGSETFARSFDFSKLPNLREVSFGFRAGSTYGGLPWIPMALSTFRPATSPHLSTIRLDLSCAPVGTRPAETLIRVSGENLRRIAGEVARIEREFEGAVKLTVLRGVVFEMALETLNILRHHGR